MNTQQQFEPKDPAELIALRFDFTDDLDTESLTGAPTATVEVTGAVADASPAAILSGIPQISGAAVVQRVTGGVLNANYRVKVVCATTGGRTLALAGILPVRAA